MTLAHAQIASSLPLEARADALCFPRGQLIEISGDHQGARSTTAVAAIIRAQREGETTAWIQYANDALYPPDLDEKGVDLKSLAVILIPMRQGEYGLLKAAELLLRSGGFGLVVVDLGRSKLRPTDTAWQGRLLGLARKHEVSLLLLTDKSAESASLGPLISLRMESRRRRIKEGVFAIEHQYLKNKMGLPDPSPQYLRGPWGLR